MKLTQLALLPTSRAKGGDVPDEIVARLPDELAAINLSIEVSGLNDQQVADQCDLEYAQLSRIRSGNMNFPPRKLNVFMDVCGTEILLRWLAMRRGYELKRRLSTVEAENEELRLKLAEKERDLEVIHRFFNDTRR